MEYSSPPCRAQCKVVEQTVSVFDLGRRVPRYSALVAGVSVTAAVASFSATYFGKIGKLVGVPCTLVPAGVSLPALTVYIVSASTFGRFASKMDQEMKRGEPIWPPPSLVVLQKLNSTDLDVKLLQSTIPTNKPDLPTYEIPELATALQRGESTRFDRQLIGQTECWAGVFLHAVSEGHLVDRWSAAEKLYYLLVALENPTLKTECSKWSVKSPSPLRNEVGEVPLLN